MAVFAGHIESGSVLSLLAIWWLVNAFRDYRRCQETGETFRSKMSYPSTFRNRKWPIEMYLKVVFMTACFLGEALHYGLNDVHFIKDGHFVRIHNLQHMSIYGMILVHGITDVLCYHKVSPMMKNMQYLTGVVSFYWFGVGFYYHSADDTHKPPLENMIHRLCMPFIFIASLSIIWEMLQRDKLMPQLLKSLCILTTGTWFINVSFILFEPNFQHTRHNPNWDQHDMRNVHFVTALYGFHIIFNSLLIMVVYALVATHDKIVRLFNRLLGKTDEKRQQHYLNGVGVGDYEKQKLLVEEDVDLSETSFD